MKICIIYILCIIVNINLAYCFMIWYNFIMKKFWIVMFFVAVAFLVFIISANANNFDFDLWARLIAGMGVVDGHQVLKADFLSYTPTHVWYDHEYGSGVVFYLILKYFGGYGLIIFQSVLLFFIFWIGNKTIKLRGIDCPYNFLFWIFPIIALCENLASPIRCHVFSFFLFTLFIYILELSRKKNFKYVYLLPVLAVLWNNLHGGVVSGIGLIILYGFGAFLDKKAYKHYIISAGLSFAFLIINPWGYEYIKFLLMANSMHRGDVAEWWGLFSIHQVLRQLPFKIFMLLIVVLELFNLKKAHSKKDVIVDKTKWIVLIVTMFLAIQHVKLLPFFVISASIFCYEDFRNIVEEKIPKYVQQVTLIIVIAFCVLISAVKKFDIPLGADVYPHREVEFIKLNDIKGNILVNFGYGSFVSYKLYPHNLIFMDGRYEEVYYDEMVPLLKKFYLLKPDWDEVLKKYPPDILIIEKFYPVYVMLNKLPEWTNVYETENFIVFVKTENKKKSYILPTNDKEYYKNTLFDTSVKF